MATLNRITLIGNLGTDPEIRQLNSGSKVAQLTLATNENYKNSKGELVEQTEWHRIELWDAPAIFSEKYLKKGDSLYVEGKLRSEKWTDSSGQERQGWKVRATSIQKLSKSAQS
ncbi:single-stranded DNA-binding protein [Marinilongibacter aquaticus]|uniref:single-stranded DNA-binding protein n=1 Tax=Marinilongibacter aquaticus TaxID=2975157 RepID=UPI0021BDAEDF|nr:single-stranded DNA-binding protein [Marinilongibacter aquaticus]UBM58181.1 single-stranded DNA-binding protein [Marinilongibacter aquaticus]